MTLVCLVLAAAAEGVGISSLLPFLGLAARAARADSAASETPEGLERAVTQAFAGLGLEPTLGVLLWAVVAALLVKAGLVMLAKRQVGYAVAQMATEMRLRLIRALLATRWAYFLRQPVGSFATAFATEARRASQAFLSGTAIASQLLGLVVYVGIAFAASWQITLASIPIAFLSVAALNYLVRLTGKAGRRQTVLLKDIIGRLTDIFQGVKPLKVMACENLVGPMLERGTQNLNKALRRQVLTKEAVATLQETVLMAYVAVGIYVAVAYFEMELATVFLLALIFIRALTAINKAQRQYQGLVTDESAYWSMVDLIERAETEREEPSGTRMPRLESEIELRDVSLRYGERRILDRLSLTIPAGEMTAVVGPSGCGKTTLVDLVVGLVHPESGAVLVDGVPLPELDLVSWRRRIGYVPQEMFLLHESVAFNVSLGDLEITRSDVERALREAGAWEFVSRMPRGMDSVVGERGSRLSGGQRQRIAIARALVRRPALLILDEATASLDGASEAALWARLEKLRPETTVLLVSHQAGVLGKADRIYGIERGGALELPAAARPAGAEHRVM